MAAPEKRGKDSLTSYAPTFSCARAKAGGGMGMVEIKIKVNPCRLSVPLAVGSGELSIAALHKKSKIVSVGAAQLTAIAES